ncbi:ABC transporter A family member 7 isoform X3 [Sorghum bicolor]|uniref:ABC transporter A family member 7 isoform X3 n=1 Tax=Sorghum bicolor TaxID=4558 RepID=UPI000B424173|nr:ABC transporter A family member 7 isoform X3 [Sorghum bicolor]|eukprot:XP_021310476.1 ABC transporter A family member 7 isoform X3 [Sorghum bicolor]
MDSPRGPASFATQANALLRKNLSVQKRNLKTNIGITFFPILICVLLIVLQNIINNELDKPKYKCGCVCLETSLDGRCARKQCGIQYSTLDQVGSCPIPSPPQWPAMIQIPRADFRAVRTFSQPFSDLPDPFCRDSWSCPATVLVTGKDKAVAEAISGGLFPVLSPSLNATDLLDLFTKIVAGSDTQPWYTQLLEPAFFSGRTLYVIQPECLPVMSQTITYNTGGIPFQLNIQCVEGVPLWRESASIINHEFLKGYRQRGGEINEFIAGYDFLGTTQYGLGVNVWYNSTYSDNNAYSFITTLRVPRLVNAVSNAYLKFIKGTGVEMLLEYVKDMPKVGTSFQLDLSSLLSVLFFTWIIELLFPVMLSYLVYEKQQKLRIMMKMHGLKDGPYWLISYSYFLALSIVYMLFFMIFGSLIGLNFFRVNEYSIQVVFFFICINLQIALAFFVASFFLSVKMATVIGYMYVFGSGLLGAFLFRFFVEDQMFPYGWTLVMEIVPAFSLYRGLYELGQYAFSGSSMGATGMTWRSLKDPLNGMHDVMIIMSVEWAVLLILAFYLDQASLLGGGVRKNPFFCFRCLQKKHAPSLHEPSNAQQDSKVILDVEKSDVALERKRVEQLLIDPNANQAIICDNLRKVYHGRDGNPNKLAVRGLSLVLQKGQCFGMLGPNGAGKTSFINMMIGLIKPTSGTAYVHGMDINMDMGNIYTNMGVCPQHKLKNLKGAELMKAVDHSLKSVNLSHGNVGDKQVKKYSGGMKRRLSVAISLIGDPKVVFMDEPSTGLDPASRNNLWNVVKEAKKNRAIILTTHSMEEAEVLCDRLGIFVDGDFQCLGNPKELKARYGGTYILTVTTPPDQEMEVEQLVHQFSPSANKIYHLSGTQKFELPKQEVKIAHVFDVVEKAKRRLTIHAWGLVDTTLEDVFIKVARGAQVFNEFV